MYHECFSCSSTPAFSTVAKRKQTREGESDEQDDTAGDRRRDFMSSRRVKTRFRPLSSSLAAVVRRKAAAVAARL